VFRSRFLSLTIVFMVLTAGLIIWRAAAAADKPKSADGNNEPSFETLPELPPTPTTPTAPRSIDSIPAPLGADAIEEILRLRRSLSGGDDSRGSTKEGQNQAADEQFRQALRSLGDQPRSSPPLPAPTAEVPPLVEPTNEPNGAVEFIPDRLPSSHADHDVLESCAADMAVVATLRDTSRLLDNRAHDLDAERRFDEAEKLRQLAARVRKDARRIESTALALEASANVVPRY